MRALWRPLAILLLALALPGLPFLLFGPQLHALLEAWQAEPASAPVTAAVVAGLLATDVFLPIPSSVLSTAAGVRLGWLLGTLVSWGGMTAGGMLGFAAARRWGPPFARRWLSADEAARMQALSERYGAATLVLVRGAPLLAEASVLWLGAAGMSWRRFLPPLALSNLGLSLAYAAFGDLAAAHEWLPAALGFAVALPVLLTAAAHRWLLKRKDEG